MPVSLYILIGLGSAKTIYDMTNPLTDSRKRAFKLQHANATRRTRIVTTFVDIDRGRQLDVVPGRSGNVLRDWVRDRPAGWPEQITVATIDAFVGYASAIRDTLPRATLVVDDFHAIRLASEPSTMSAAVSSRPRQGIVAARALTAIDRTVAERPTGGTANCDPGNAVRAGSVAERKRGDDEITLATPTTSSSTSSTTPMNSWPIVPTARGLMPRYDHRSDPHTHDITTRTTASVGAAIAASGRVPISIVQGP